MGLNIERNLEIKVEDCLPFQIGSSNIPKKQDMKNL